MKTWQVVPLAAATLLFGSAAGLAANTSCINGLCFTCEGALACSPNGRCTCNGVPVQGKPAAAVQQPNRVPGAEAQRAAGPAQCPGARVALDVSTDLTPYVHMRLGSKEGWFKVDTGYEYSFVDYQTYGVAKPGTRGRIAGSTFPTLEAEDFNVLDAGSFSGPQGQRVAGVIGADILGRRTVELHYDDRQPYLMVSAQACPARGFEDQGFIPIPQQGYYSWDRKRLRTDGSQVLNVPVLFLRLGTVIAPVEIDSGYADDTNNGIILINDALFQALRNAGISMEPLGSGRLRDCIGAEAPSPRWRLVDAPLALGRSDGQTVVSYGPPVVQVRPRSSAACGGGMGARREPWALIGSMQLLQLGAIVLDGLNERVWIRRTRLPDAPKPPFRAIALAWNDDAQWSLTTGLAPESVNADALKACNSSKTKGGECALAATADPTSFICLSLAAHPQDKRGLSWAKASSWDGSRKDALDRCNRAVGGNECKINYTLCNG